MFKYFLFIFFVTPTLFSCKKNDTNNPVNTNLPSVTSHGVLYTTGTTALSGGEVVSAGAFPVTQRGVCWSTNQNPTTADHKTSDSSGTGVFSSTLTNLAWNTTYYVRAYASNSAGTSYGKQVSFATSNGLALDTAVTSLTSDMNGNIYAGGFMYVGKWSSSNWTVLQSSLLNMQVVSIIADGNGNLYAGGESSYVAKWNGSTWSKLGNLNANGRVYILAKDGPGNIYAAGYFKNSAGKYYVAKWNGVNWTELSGLNANAEIYGLTADNAGNIYAAGNFKNSNGKRYVAKWNGSNWIGLPGFSGAFDDVDIMTMVCDASNNLYIGGRFYSSVAKVAKWDGNSWTELGQGIGVAHPGLTGSIIELIIDHAGVLYAGGKFYNANKKNFVAKWNGSSWEELGGGFTSLPDSEGEVYSLTKDADNNIYAGGLLRHPGTKYYIAKWTKSTNTWSVLGK